MKGARKPQSEKRDNIPKAASKPMAEPKSKLYAALFENGTFINRIVCISIIILLLIGFFLRLMNVGVLSFWSDEFVHVIRARDVVFHHGPLFTSDNNGILLTIFMIPFFLVFGVSEWIARFPSVLFSTISVYLVFLVGKRLFGSFVGWTAAALSSVSLYLVYWGRIARNYAIFEFFYLLLLYLLLLALQEPKSGNAFWKKWKVNPKYLAMLFIGFFLAVMTHQLIFLFFISLGFYLIGISLSKIITREPDRFKNIYFYGAMISLIILGFLFIPFLQPVTASIFRSVVYENLRQFVIPDWTQTATSWNGEHRWTSFLVYFQVMEKDMPVLFGYAIFGVLLSMLIRWQSGWFLFCFSMVPFLMLSLVYRDPCDPRYMIFFYPLMLIGIGCFFYFFSFYLFNDFIKKKWSKWIALTVFFIFLGLLFFEIRYNDLRMLAAGEKKTGNIVDKELSKWTFVDWRDELSYVKSIMKPGETIMSTNAVPVAYYLGLDSVIWFRQRKLNGVTRKYEELPTADTSGHSAHSFKELKATYEKNQRGWLIADYYLMTVFTDDDSRNFVWKNMTFHFDATRTGTTQVFSWDHSQPRQYDPDFVFEMGKNDMMMRSEPLEMVMSKTPPGKLPYVLLLVEGLDNDQEGYMIINHKKRIFLPYHNKKGPQYSKMIISPDAIQEGLNTFTFYYKPGSPDPHPGYVLYKLTGGFTSAEVAGKNSDE